MEYLPEKKRTQKVQVMKKDEKTKQFREYLADSDVVLAIVKCKHAALGFRLGGGVILITFI
jgi:hypothetical protein